MATETRNGTTTTYSYDAANQLTGDGTTNLTYDGNGNRTNTGYSIGTGNQLLSDGTWNYAYDNEGNETSKTITSTGEIWTYTYDQKNQLLTASHTPNTGASADLTASYKYDALGNRIETDVWTSGVGTVVTKFALDGWKKSDGHMIGNENWNVWADLNGSGSLTTRYLRGDVVDQVFAELSYSGGTYTPNWTLTDRLGSVGDVIDNSATVEDSITYGAFGKITSETNSSERGRYAWTGRELDVETGLQYNRARYYDSQTGRWISNDPLGFDGGDCNLYRYVHNRPAMFADPSGLQAPDIHSRRDFPDGSIIRFKGGASLLIYQGGWTYFPRGETSGITVPGGFVIPGVGTAPTPPPSVTPPPFSTVIPAPPGSVISTPPSITGTHQLPPNVFVPIPPPPVIPTLPGPILGQFQDTLGDIFPRYGAGQPLPTLPGNAGIVQGVIGWPPGAPGHTWTPPPIPDTNLPPFPNSPIPPGFEVSPPTPGVMYHIPGTPFGIGLFLPPLRLPLRGTIGPCFEFTPGPK